MSAPVLEKEPIPAKPSRRRTLKNKIHRFIERNRMNTGLTLSAIIQGLIILFWYTPEIKFNKLDRLVEEVAFVDSIKITDPSNSEAPPDDGEIELTEKKKVQEDPRIAGAQDAAISGATAPIDLSPGIRPEYTVEARQEGVTGTITLEVIIADSGEVLQVRSVGRKLGFGLEESAIETYKIKKFSPSILEGRAVTVKVLVPIRFTLN